VPDDAETGRAPGRPRDEEVGPAILAAARRLVGERGYDAVTTRMIADAAGAGKQSIYRRWPSKAELVLDAFLAYAEAEVDAPGHAPAPILDQVSSFIRRTFAALVDTGPAVRGLMATAQQDDAFRAIFRSRFIDPRRRALAGLLRSAIADGLLPPDADVEVATIMLFGAVWYRLLLDEPMDDQYPERLAALVVNGMSQGRGRHR
jgi:AcrR family transcriptional regulator